jgi:hypothetical protein
MTGFSLSLTLRVRSLSGIRPSPLGYGGRSLTNLIGIDDFRQFWRKSLEQSNAKSS